LDLGQNTIKINCSAVRVGFEKNYFKMDCKDVEEAVFHAH
jgi:hypothetical protein